ncbi:MAG: hypothetical protein E7107_00835 [Prevotella sp.]|jgi:hypothetical protein|nr:hypothetical protein [Prevotella sp.]
MKRSATLIACLIMASLSFGQAKKPKLMVVPSQIWCSDKGYVTTFDNQGTQEEIPDYKRALQNNRELMNVISKINILMADRGFPLQDLSQSLRSIQNTQAENSLIRTKTSGAALLESPLDQLRRTAKADIILEVDWQVNTTGPKRSVTYNLRGLDAYTNFQIAGAQGTGAPSFSAEVAVLLEEAVQNNMDNFTAQLQAHFDDLMENGRQVVIELQIPDNGSGLDFEQEYDGKELTEILDDWMADNTVNHRFSKSEATENWIMYDQVRIPLYRPNGAAMDTDAFARQIRDFLRKPPYGITCKIVNRGLGRSLIIVGEK